MVMFPYSEALQEQLLLLLNMMMRLLFTRHWYLKLTAAVNLINATAFPANDPSDIYFNASKARWKQLANTIKLRLILRRINVSGYNPASDIASISADGFIDAPRTQQPGYVKSSGKLNQYYSNYGFNENDALPEISEKWAVHC